jgi:hypothetical protein
MPAGSGYPGNELASQAIGAAGNLELLVHAASHHLTLAFHSKEKGSIGPGHNRPP